MSMDIHAVALIGYKVPDDKIEYAFEKYEEYYDMKTRQYTIPIEVVYDSMSGDYAYIGIVLGRLSSEEWAVQTSNVPNIDVFDLAEQIERYFPELVDEDDGIASDNDIKFHMFNEAH